MEKVTRVVWRDFRANNAMETPTGKPTTFDLIDKIVRVRINTLARGCGNGSGRKGRPRKDEPPLPLPLPAPPQAAGAFEPYLVRFDHSLTTSPLNQREPAPLLKTRTPARTPTCLPPLGGSSRLRRRLR